MTQANRQNGQPIPPDQRGVQNAYATNQMGPERPGAGPVHSFGMGRGAANAAPRQGASQDVLYQKPKKRKPASFWIAIVVAVVCIILACVLIFTMTGGGKGARQGAQGQLDGKTQEEIQAELDRVVEEGMFNISIASVVQLEDGASEGDLRIENVPGNHYLMKVVITRDDTGEQIYKTDFIEPDHHIQKDTLDVVLPAGDYDCTATFEAYDLEDESSVGQAAAKMRIQVLN